MKSIKKGELVDVINKDKHGAAGSTYYLAYLNDRPHLFTKHEIGRAHTRAIKNPEDVLSLAKPSFITRLLSIFG